MFVDSIVFDQLIYCLFLQTVVDGGKKIDHIFVNVINGWPPNLSDWINLAVNQEPRDYDLGHPKDTKKKSCSVFKSGDSHGSLSKISNK